MNNIVPLVSFPKSGNTWMRFLLSNLFKKDKNLQINFNNINTFSPTSRYQNLNNFKNHLTAESPIFIKEHINFKDLEYDDFKKAIYIYRNGFDALLSYWHFTNARLPKKYANIETFSKYYWDYCGHWGDHIHSWLYSKKAQSSHSIYAISYEDLMLNPFKTLNDCLIFLGYEFSSQEIEKAIFLSSKEKMSAMENSAEFMKSRVKHFNFVRSATTNESKKNLPLAPKKEFMKNKRNYQLMVKLGYTAKINEWGNLKKINNNTKTVRLKNRYYNYRYLAYKKINSLIK